jgi:hypothetical protein
LCPTIHRFYDDQFTANYYLSTTNTIFARYGDIPFECNKRIGFLLNEEELKEYFKEEYEAGYQPKDVWWNPYKGNSIDDFISKVRLTEPRMLSNKELIVDIYKSKTISGNNITIVEGDNYECATLATYKADGKKSFWTFYLKIKLNVKKLLN